MLRSKRGRPAATEVPMETALIAVDEYFEKLAQLEAVAPAPSMLSDLHVGRLLAAAAATRCAGEWRSILLRSTISGILFQK